MKKDKKYYLGIGLFVYSFIPYVFTFLVLGLSVTPREAGAVSTSDDAAIKAVLQPWKGDLNGMIERRFIRVLVTYNKTDFFLDGADNRGFTHEIFQKFDKFLYKKLIKKGAIQKHLRINIVYLPVSRDQLLPYLNKGLGDIAAGNLTITPKRLEKVDFATPYYADAKELVVTGPSAPPINSVADLSGKTVYVRRSSSYFETLTRLNEKFTGSGKAPIKIDLANEHLETEDILEMVNADLIPKKRIFLPAPQNGIPSSTDCFQRSARIGQVRLTCYDFKTAKLV